MSGKNEKKIFEYRGNHKKRNEHFFCCLECSYEFKVKKIYVSCDWCGNPIYKKRSDVARNEHNFCDYGCYIDYVNFEKAGADNQMISGIKTVSQACRNEDWTKTSRE